MKKLKKIFFILFLLTGFIFSCEKEKEKEPVTSDVVVNEFLPVNSTIAPDQDGEYNDWIELFNLSSSTIDISGYYLTDNKSKITKWKVPSGTIIGANEYLIIWADKDTTQSGLHANFKLSSAGEELVFTMPDLTIIDEIKYPAQSLELSYSRIPNGTGNFQWLTPTFNTANISPE